MSDPTPDEVAAGHAFYTRRSLAIYDAMILGYFSRLAWRCPAARIRAHYDEHASANHLDVGPGTGYFLDHCRWPSPTPRLALLDANAACLDHASKRLARFQPERHQASVLDPVEVDVPRFDSVGMNYLLHCLPGTIRSKGVVLANLAPLCEPGATVFGATLLSGGVRRNWFARQVMARNNRVGIFSNEHDDLDGLQTMLGEHLTDVRVDVVGCVGVFSGRV